ncbi:MAG: MFS transporter [Caulobacter sp.]|nr:MFS transporter [Caulobacter sp.]
MPPAPTPASTTRFPAYLFAHGAWFLAFGVQMVLFPYLVRVVLQENEVRFGLAQMCLQLPTTLLILIGGFVADRGSPRRIVVVAYGLCVLTFLGLGLLVVGDRLTYGLIITYALTVGAIGAFAMPARDSLLSLVAPGGDGASVQKAVSFAALAQFAAQILGMIIATAAPVIGVGPMLLGLSGLMAAAAIAAVTLKPRPPAPNPRAEGKLVRRMVSDIGGGMKAVAASPVIAPVVICATAMGVCFMGSFFVLLPLIVQSYFADSVEPTRIASALALFSLCFWSGSMISALLLVRFGHVRRKGIVYLLSLASGGLVLIACAVTVPFPVLCGLNFVWGLGGGIAMTLGRGLVQQYSTPETRGRVLSIFTLGLMGGGPLGAVTYGYMSRAIGPHLSIIFPGALMLAIVAGVWFLSPLRRLNEEAGGGMAPA